MLNKSLETDNGGAKVNPRLRLFFCFTTFSRCNPILVEDIKILQVGNLLCRITGGCSRRPSLVVGLIDNCDTMRALNSPPFLIKILKLTNTYSSGKTDGSKVAWPGQKTIVSIADYPRSREKIRERRGEGRHSPPRALHYQVINNHLPLGIIMSSSFTRSTPKKGDSSNQ